MQGIGTGALKIERAGGESPGFAARNQSQSKLKLLRQRLDVQAKEIGLVGRKMQRAVQDLFALGHLASNLVDGTLQKDRAVVIGRHLQHALGGVTEIRRLCLRADGRHLDNVELVTRDADPQAQPLWLAFGIGAAELSADAGLVDVKERADVVNQLVDGDARIRDEEGDALVFGQRDNALLGRGRHRLHIVKPVPQPVGCNICT